MDIVYAVAPSGRSLASHVVEEMRKLGYVRAFGSRDIVTKQSSVPTTEFGLMAMASFRTRNPTQPSPPSLPSFEPATTAATETLLYHRRVLVG